MLPIDWKLEHVADTIRIDTMDMVFYSQKPSRPHDAQMGNPKVQ